MKRFRWICGLLILFLLAVIVTYLSVPTANTAATHFDTIIIVGCPTLADGGLSPMQRARVQEGVREYRLGHASHIILSGGAAHNRYIEANVMAAAALGMGIPSEALFIEDQGKNTLGNIFFSNIIMRDHGWKSAEVVSSQNHLPRLGVILALYSFGWHTHAATWPIEISTRDKAMYYMREIAATVIVRWYGFRSDDVVPVTSS